MTETERKEEMLPQYYSQRGGYGSPGHRQRSYLHIILMAAAIFTVLYTFYSIYDLHAKYNYELARGDKLAKLNLQCKTDIDTAEKIKVKLSTEVSHQDKEIQVLRKSDMSNVEKIDSLNREKERVQLVLDGKKNEYIVAQGSLQNLSDQLLESKLQLKEANDNLAAKEKEMGNVEVDLVNANAQVLSLRKALEEEAARTSQPAATAPADTRNNENEKSSLTMAPTTTGELPVVREEPVKQVRPPQESLEVVPAVRVDVPEAGADGANGQIGQVKPPGESAAPAAEPVKNEDQQMDRPDSPKNEEDKAKEDELAPGGDEPADAGVNPGGDKAEDDTQDDPVNMNNAGPDVDPANNDGPDVDPPHNRAADVDAPNNGADADVAQNENA